MDTAKSSWAVLQHDRELAVLPVLGALASIAVVLAAIGHAHLAFHRVGLTTGAAAAGSDPMLWIGGIIILLAVTVITVFFNAAVVSGARETVQRR